MPTPNTAELNWCIEKHKGCECPDCVPSAETVTHIDGATTMSEKHETTIDALQAVMVAACAHVSATGWCDDVPFDYDEHDGPYCHNEACTYCALARACDGLEVPGHGLCRAAGLSTCSSGPAVRPRPCGGGAPKATGGH